MKKVQHFWIDGDLEKALRDAADWLKHMELNSDGVIAMVSQYDNNTGYTVIIVYRDKLTR